MAEYKQHKRTILEYMNIWLSVVYGSDSMASITQWLNSTIFGILSISNKEPDCVSLAFRWIVGDFAFKMNVIKSSIYDARFSSAYVIEPKIYGKFAKKWRNLRRFYHIFSFLSKISICVNCNIQMRTIDSLNSYHSKQLRIVFQINIAGCHNNYRHEVFVALESRQTSWRRFVLKLALNFKVIPFFLFQNEPKNICVRIFA